MRCLALLPVLLAAPALAASPAHPVVVELFQSQGCSSCPPAEANLNAIAGRADVLALSFAVTYWDQLGWKDIFAQPAFTARQWEYAHAAGRAQVATPQMIVDGRTVLVGSNRAQVDAALSGATRGNAGPAVAARDGKVAIGAGATRGSATVWLVRYDTRTLAVPIRAGENGGKTLPHRNIVRSLTPLGVWSGKPVSLPLPQYRYNDTNLRSAVLVQDGKGGPILAAARL